MIEGWKKFLSSYKTSFLLLALYALLMGVATWVEKSHGSEVAKNFFYHSPIFLLLYILIVLNLVAVTIRRKLLRKDRLSYLILHGSFVVILGGALISFLFAEEGLMHIREGGRSRTIFIKEGKGMRQKELPFELELKDFRLIRYPGSGSPSSYESDIIVHQKDGHSVPAQIYMNNVLDYGGYRFFQASYDEDEQGTILSVSNDLPGTVVTYIGYLLLTLGFLLMFFEKKGLFRRLIHQLSVLQRSLILLFLMGFSFSLQAQTPYATLFENPIPEAHAQKFGHLPVQWNGRIVPMNTVASEVLRKLHKEHHVGNLTPEQFLLSLLALPQMWMQVPFIETPSIDVAIATGLSPEQFAFAEAFDEEGNYKLLAQMNKAYRTPQGERTALQKELLKVDERINIFHSLYTLELLALYPDPDDPTHTWYPPSEERSSFYDYLQEVRTALTTGEWSRADGALEGIKQNQLRADTARLINPSKIKAEVKYNQSHIFAKCRILYLVLGGLLLVIAFATLLDTKKRKVWKTIGQILTSLLLLAICYHIYGMGLRWYIGGYAPWSNSYETMVYISLATVLGGVILGRVSLVTKALATLLSGVVLFVSGLNWMDPQIGTLVPVLKSPWLMFHVAVIVAAYGFFGIGGLLSIANLLIAIVLPPLRRTRLHIQELSIISKLSLMIGLALMTVGTFLGAVWANESWGRYWGWDPKETWALITVVVYAIVVHLHLLKNKNPLWLYNVCSIFAMASVLMTYFGVNYFLSGMHSYGYSGGLGKGFTIVLITFVLLAILSVIAYRRFRRLSGSKV